MNQIHIVGCSPRSGTTLMAEMMGNCFDIDIKTEGEQRITIAPPHRGNTLLTKTPKDIILIKDMLYFMKNLYVIYMLRDPRDVIVSKHPWDKDRYWTSLKVWKMWAAMGNEMRDHPRFITVRYEDLVAHPNDIQRMIEEKLPFLKKTIPFSDFYWKAKPSSYNLAALKGVRPVSTNSVGNWRCHKARLAGQIHKYGSINNELINYGYEKDADWEKELEGVEPDMSDSHPAVFTSEGYIKRKLRWNKFRSIRVMINHSRAFLFLKEMIHQR